jgi:hypothetical protein
LGLQETGEVMIAAFLAWKAKRAARKKAAQFELGRQFAAEHFFWEAVPADAIERLESMVDTARLMGDYNDFDAGIEDYLKNA